MKRIAILIALATANCQTPPAPPPALSAPVGSNEESDSWNRSLQCADHAERLGTRMQRDYARSPQDAQVMTWTSHYNSSDERCYAELGSFNPRPPPANETRGSNPRLYQELYDAVEGVQLAGSASGFLNEIGRDVYCTVADRNRTTRPVSDCAEARTFITDKMTK